MCGRRIRRRLAALTHRDLRLFFVGEATSLLGSSMASLALAFAVLGGGGTQSDLGYVMAARILPMVVLLPIAGVAGDRLGPRRVMVAADVLRCVTQATLAGLLLTGHSSVWALVALVAVWGAGEAFSMPARGALIPRVAGSGLVYEGKVRDANALAGLAQSAASVCGPAIAGVAVAVMGPGAVIGLDAGTYAVSAVALTLLRLSGHTAAPAGGGPTGGPEVHLQGFPGAPGGGDGDAERDLRSDTGGDHDRRGPCERGPREQELRERGAQGPRGRGPRERGPRERRPQERGLQEQGKERGPRGGGLREGWEHFRSRPWLWITTLQFTLFNMLVWAPFLVLGPVVAHERLGGAGAWGLIMACYGCGAVGGGFAMMGGRVVRRPLVVATVATFGWALPSAAVGAGAPALVVAGAALVAGAGSAVCGTLYATTNQEYLPVGVLARVTSLTSMGAFALGPAGLAAAGPAASAAGVTAVLGFGAIWQVVAGCVVLAVPSVRNLPAASARRESGEPEIEKDGAATSPYEEPARR
ncbi:MFS transporter [Sphaerisporangium dianthi]|uniref:MFS transporter n=1 Tax=Sphaerisporangium dianthi TaxID=1436120 RepID=A0ABV9CF36_9ACTN